ncbi:MAG TPA: DMT family transporter [Thermohalobaculum sp.]|nr:DMT family transporter [Thermohalobaculum sp.]
MLLSSLVLGERIGPNRIAAVALGFAGVCLVLGVGSVPLEAVMLLPLGAGLLYGLNVMVTRSWCADESSICLATWQTLFFLGAGAVGLMLAPGLARLVGDVPGTGFITMEPTAVTSRGLVLAALIGLSGLLGGGLLATGYRLGRSSVVGLFDYSFLVWAPLFGWLIRGEGVALRTVGGMALIALAGVLAMRAGRRMEARQAAARRGG